MSSRKNISCKNCGEKISIYQNPVPTVDAVIYDKELGILLIERKNEPFGWALPGGFVDYKEKLSDAALREAKEETSLDIEIKGLVGIYSDPSRDPRQHTISTVFWGKAKDLSCLKAADDALKAAFFKQSELPSPIVFDHSLIIQDFFNLIQDKQNVAWR